MPIILTALALFIWMQVVVAGAPQPHPATGKTSLGELFEWAMVLGTFLWFGTLVAAATWMISILGLALLPSRAAEAQKRNKLRIG